MAKKIKDIIAMDRGELSRQDAERNLKAGHKAIQNAIKSIENCIYHQVDTKPITIDGKTKSKEDAIKVLDEALNQVAEICFAFEIEDEESLL